MAGRARADRHAEPGTRSVIRHDLDDEQVIRETVACASHALELRGSVKLVAGPKSLTPRRTSLVSDVR
jgi:hypothetical protein